jgi:hypothetical protein
VEDEQDDGGDDGGEEEQNPGTGDVHRVGVSRLGRFFPLVR